MVIVLGGDGSFLRAAELAQHASVPVLGINLGRIGFLAEAEADHLEEALHQVVRRQYSVENRMTLDVTIRVDDVIVDRGWALNEASLENQSRLGVLEVVLEVDGRPVSSFGGDGVLIATPTGSTAYAFSAGGPIVWPELEALLVIPSNAHALFARPLVTSPKSIIAVETSREATPGWCSAMVAARSSSRPEAASRLSEGNIPCDGYGWIRHRSRIGWCASSNFR